MKFAEALALEVKKVAFRGVRMSSAQRRQIATGQLSFMQHVAPRLVSDRFTAEMQNMAPAERGKVFGDNGKPANLGTTPAKLRKAGVNVPMKAHGKKASAYAKRREKLMQRRAKRLTARA